MEDLTPLSPNGHRAVTDGYVGDTAHHENANPYADMVSGSQPREIAEFALNTDPYANVLPRPGKQVGLRGDEADYEDDESDEHETRRRSPLVILVSVFLILVLVLPLVVAVFARLGI